MAKRCPKCKAKKAFIKGRLVGKQLSIFRGNFSSFSLFDKEEYRYECVRCGFVQIRRG